MLAELLALIALYTGTRALIWIYFTYIRDLDHLKQYRKSGDEWALITGASDGIGLGYAKVLARAGFNIVLLGRNPEKLGSVKEELSTQVKTRIITVVSEASDCSDDNFSRVHDAVKDLPVSILVNNVGAGQGARHLEDMNPAQVRAMVNVNVTYAVLLTQKLLPLLQKTAGRKAILNISSASTFAEPPLQPIYPATKAFNRSFSHSLAVDLALDGVDVLAVIPGFVSTNMTKMRESLICCGPEECAELSLKWLGWTTEVVPHPKHLLMVLLVLLVKSMIPSVAFIKGYAYIATGLKRQLYPPNL